MTQKKIRVAAAILIRGDRVLVSSRPADRSHCGKWEFPGGKADTGETLQEALKREMQEELALDVTAEDFFCSVTPAPGLEISFFFCSTDSDAQPTAREGQEWYWADAEMLKKLDFLPADLPVVAKIASLLKNLSP